MSFEQPTSANHSLSVWTQWQPPSPPQTPRLRPTTSQKESTCSTRATTPLSLSQHSFPSSSPPLGSSDVDGCGNGEQNLVEPQISILPSPNKSRVSDPAQVAIRPQLPPARHSHNTTAPATHRGRTIQRRCVSADVAITVRSHFSSPDRFVTSRSSPLCQDSPYRFNKPPAALSPGEKLTRERDHSQDPFRSPSASRSRQIVRQSSVSRRNNAPHFVPQFVQDNEHSDVQRDSNSNIDIQRQASAGAIWNVGGNAAAFSGPPMAIDNGHGGLTSSGSNAPLLIAHFLDNETQSQDVERHRSRLSLALDIDDARRILRNHNTRSSLPRPLSSRDFLQYSPLNWQNGTWMRDGQTHGKYCALPSRLQIDRIQVPSTSPIRAQKALPATPFRVLDAPRLRDDFYCSTLAYCDTARTLAVGLSPRVYLWSEEAGVRYPPLTSPSPTDYVTSLSFSSTEGGKSILAVGRLSGQILLWSTFELGVRFEAQQPNPVSCLSFSPFVTMRQSEFLPEEQVPCEDLLVGDDVGNVFYYSIEWPDASSLRKYPQWTGSMTLLAKVTAHSQQICGFSWSPDKKHFATGGNDNLALLFEISKVLAEERNREAVTSIESALNHESLLPILRAPPYSPVARRRSHIARLLSRSHVRGGPHDGLPPASHQTQSFSPPSFDPRPSSTTLLISPETPEINTLPMTRTFHYIQDRVDPSASTATYSTLIPTYGVNTIQKHTFPHAAAVKALAFPLWQPTLLATGGGSNDRAIHFFHTSSGATLATISVHAQVTALIWSKTRREVCATFGYAQPEHGIRIAVFAWPSCECVVNIPWTNEAVPSGTGGGRALWAIAYPGGPNDGSTSSRIRSARRERIQREGGNGMRGTTVRAVAEGDGEQGREGDETATILEEQTDLQTPRQQRRRRPRQRRQDHQRTARVNHSPATPQSPSRAPHGDGEGGTWWSRTEQEGCIIVASSDESVKFHEVWAGRSTTSASSNRYRNHLARAKSPADWLGLGLGSRAGVLGGSDILEGVCEGIDGDGDGFGAGPGVGMGAVIR